MTNDLATIENANELAFAPVNGFINTCDLDTLDGKKKTANAINGAVSLNDYVGVVLNIVDVITMPGTRKGRNGMPDTECQNTYLIDDKGVAYFSQSSGVARSLSVNMSIYQTCDAGKGYLPMVCKAETLPNGNTLKTLIVVDE